MGGDQNAQSEMLVGSYINRKATRCLEAWAGDEVADLYYSSYCIGCQDCMFSFNLIGQRHCIGNSPLPKEKYLEVKRRLLERLAGELMSKKRLPSLIGFVPPLEGKPSVRLAQKAKEKQDMARIEQEFAQTSKLILGSALPGGIDCYSAWLSRNIFEVKKAKSALSGGEIFTSRLLFSELAPKDRLIGADEAPEAGEQLKLSESEASTLERGNARSLAKSPFSAASGKSARTRTTSACPYR